MKEPTSMSEGSRDDTGVLSDVNCEACGGDGKEHCSNPDHNFIVALGGEYGRLGCPLCRYPDSTLIVNGGECEECNGTGLNQSKGANKL